jgi:glucose-6-phosphate 1-dehydrogenase
MSQIIIPVDPFDYVVFGGTGDLAERKLSAGALSPADCRPADRSDPDHRRFALGDGAMTSYRNFARDALTQHLKDGEYA